MKFKIMIGASCFSIFYCKMVVICLRVLATFWDQRVLEPQVNHVPSLTKWSNLLIISQRVYM